MAEVLSTPKTASAQPKQGSAFVTVPPDKREYQQMLWEYTADTEYRPIATLPFILDPRAGKIRLVESVERRSDVRAERTVVKGSIAFPRSWPFSWALDQKQVQAICNRSYERGISLVESFVQFVGRAKFSPEFLAMLRKAPAVYWRPRQDDGGVTFSNARAMDRASDFHTGQQFAEDGSGTDVL